MSAADAWAILPILPIHALHALHVKLAPRISAGLVSCNRAKVTESTRNDTKGSYLLRHLRVICVVCMHYVRVFVYFYVVLCVSGCFYVFLYLSPYLCGLCGVSKWQSVILVHFSCLILSYLIFSCLILSSLSTNHNAAWSLSHASTTRLVDGSPHLLSSQAEIYTSAPIKIRATEEACLLLLCMYNIRFVPVLNGYLILSFRVSAFLLLLIIYCFMFTFSSFSLSSPFCLFYLLWTRY